jgi:hypothetical protein
LLVFTAPQAGSYKPATLTKKDHAKIYLRAEIITLNFNSWQVFKKSVKNHGVIFNTLKILGGWHFQTI